jgi:hypothetical protein
MCSLQHNGFLIKTDCHFDRAEKLVFPPQNPESPRRFTRKFAKIGQIARFQVHRPFGKDEKV